MAMLIQDARIQLSQDALQAIDPHKLFDLLYADDTLILGVLAMHAAEFAAAVSRGGRTYGMELPWGKTQALCMCTEARIVNPDGAPIGETGSLEYLGALLAGK